MTKAVGAVLREHGGGFSVEELTLAQPAPDAVLVRVVATGLCHTDQKVRGGARDVPVPVVRVRQRGRLARSEPAARRPGHQTGTNDDDHLKG